MRRLLRNPIGGVLVVLCGVVLLGANPGRAANTGTLSGLIEDTEGVPLANVSVQISSAVLIGGPQLVTSDAGGRFSFFLLPVGEYLVEAERAGFIPAAAVVRVQSNREAAVRFRLVAESFSGEIEVSTAVPVVDTSQVNAGMVLDTDYLSKALVGTANRYYQQILSQAAGVIQDPSPFRQDLSVYGSTSGENAYLVDGLNTSDPTTGRWTIHFNIDAVQELSIQTGGFEAEFGQATGGIVNLITKSGGNQFSGTLDLRYRGESFTESGAHYDPDERRESHQQYAATLGGPLRRDRLWFFTSAQYINTVTREVGALFPYDWKGWQLLAKSTWQISHAARGVLKLSSSPVEITGSNMGRNVLESAMRTREEGGNHLQAQLDAVLSDAWLLEAQLGTTSPRVKVSPTSLSPTEPAHNNEDSGSWYGGSGLYYDHDQRRREALVSATWFVDELLGAHELKGGLGYSRTSFGLVSYPTGGATVTDYNAVASATWDPIDLNGDGYFNRLVTVREPEDRARERVHAASDLWSAYVQDAWRPGRGLTVKAGLRYDRVRLENEAAEQIADMARWQPRLGVAWDLFGTARHVVRGSVARFMDPTSLSLPSFASGVDRSGDHEYTTLEYFCNTTSGVFCTIDDLPASWEAREWTAWNGQEYVLVLRNQGFWIPNAADTVDLLGVGHLRAPYVDELILAYEAEVAHETSFELSYVHRQTKDLIEDTCPGNSWAWGDGPPPSVEDPATWTTVYPGCVSNWVLVNMPGLKRSYEAWILRFEANREWGHLMASYTRADNYWNTLSGPDNYAWGDSDYFPADFYNRYGKLGRPNQIRVNGYVLLPRGFTVALDGTWASSNHLGVISWCNALVNADSQRSTRDQMAELGVDPELMSYCYTPDEPASYLLGDSYIFLERWGSRETPSYWQLDLQLSKSFQLAGFDLQAMISVYNLFGKEAVDDVNYTAFAHETDDEGNSLRYQDDDPSLPYYDEYYGADNSPVLMPIGAPLGYQRPRRYEIGVRLEF